MLVKVLVNSGDDKKTVLDTPAGKTFARHF